MDKVEKNESIYNPNKITASVNIDKSLLNLQTQSTALLETILFVQSRILANLEKKDILYVHDEINKYYVAKQLDIIKDLTQNPSK